MIFRVFSLSLLLTFPGAVLAQSPILAEPEDGQYRGKFNSNPHAPNSPANPYGRYGSPHSPDSANNPYGKYGNRFSPNGARNPYTANSGRLDPFEDDLLDLED